MTHPALVSQLRRDFSGPEGGSARVVVSWTLAGGAAAGGILAGALALMGRSTPGLLVLIGSVLYLLGTVMGLLHGMVLAVAGRPRHVSRRDALRRAALGAAVSLPLLPLSWLTSAAVTVGSALSTGFRLGWLLVGGGGVVGAVALVGWAAWEGWMQARRAYGRLRWRHIALLTTTLIVLGGAAGLERLGPAFPGLGRSPGWHVSLTLSLALTLWVWVPVVYVVLHQGPTGDPGLAADPG